MRYTATPRATKDYNNDVVTTLTEDIILLRNISMLTTQVLSQQKHTSI